MSMMVMMTRLVTRVLDVVQVAQVHLLLDVRLVTQVKLSVRLCDVTHVHVLCVQPMGPVGRQGIANEQSALLLDLDFLVAMAGMKQMGHVRQVLLLAHVKQMISWALDLANVARGQSCVTSRRQIGCVGSVDSTAVKTFEWYEEFADIGVLPLFV